MELIYYILYFTFCTKYLKPGMHFISAKFKLTPFKDLVTTYNYVIGQI